MTTREWTPEEAELYWEILEILNEEGLESPTTGEVRKTLAECKRWTGGTLTTSYLERIMPHLAIALRPRTAKAGVTGRPPYYCTDRVDARTLFNPRVW